MCERHFTVTDCHAVGQPRARGSGPFHSRDRAGCRRRVGKDQCTQPGDVVARRSCKGRAVHGRCGSRATTGRRIQALRARGRLRAGSRGLAGTYRRSLAPPPPRNRSPSHRLSAARLPVTADLWPGPWCRRPAPSENRSGLAPRRRRLLTRLQGRLLQFGGGRVSQQVARRRIIVLVDGMTEIAGHRRCLLHPRRAAAGGRGLTAARPASNHPVRSIPRYHFSAPERIARDLSHPPSHA